MFIEFEKIKKDKSKQVKIIYSISLILVIILKMIALSLRKWVEYCWWEFGLITAQTFKHFSAFDNENYVIDVQNDACMSLKPLTNHYCTGFCTHIEDIEIGGIAMTIMGYFSVLMQGLCLGFHIWNYIFPNFKFRRIWVWIIFPFIVYFAGFLTWYLVIKPNDIENFDSIEYDKFGRQEFKFKEAFYLAIVTIVLDAAALIYGFIKTRKEFFIEIGTE